ncbi:unnamed protein product [Peniophora sp. CBMAI 1063]|nr:unnamed protein product [Peniophora sp. CBMAI 1063]
MSSVASDTLKYARDATEQIDDLVRRGEGDELRVLHEEWASRDEHIDELMARNRQACADSFNARVRLLQDLEEIRSAARLLADEKACLDGEIDRLLLENAQSREEPMLEHVRHAKAQTAFEYHELDVRLREEYAATNASIGKVIDELSRWNEEMGLLQGSFEDLNAAADAIGNILERLEAAEAEVADCHTWTCTRLVVSFCSVKAGEVGEPAFAEARLRAGKCR